MVFAFLCGLCELCGKRNFILEEKMKKLLVAIILLLIPVAANADHSLAKEQLSGLDIVRKWDNRPEGKDISTKATFTLVNKRGQERIRRTRRYLIDMEGKKGFDEKSIIFFDKPTDVKGTSLLNWSYTDVGKDDDQWLYLPALRKIKRIASSDKEKAFMGSDLTFDDMGDRNVEEDIHKLVKVEEFNGKPCYVIEMVPKEKGYMYSKKIIWIDKKEFTDYRTDFYDRKGRFLKRQVINWTKVDGIWVVKKMEVKNDQTGHSTVIEVSDIKLNKGLKDGLFTKRKMESGR